MIKTCMCEFCENLRPSIKVKLLSKNGKTPSSSSSSSSWTLWGQVMKVCSYESQNGLGLYILDLINNCCQQQEWQLRTNISFNFLSRRYPQFGLYPCIFSTIFIRFNLPLVSEFPCLSNLVKPNNSSHKRHICATTNFWDFFSFRNQNSISWF
jgi:hypothetical protein